MYVLPMGVLRLSFCGMYVYTHVHAYTHTCLFILFFSNDKENRKGGMHFVTLYSYTQNSEPRLNFTCVF